VTTAPIEPPSRTKTGSLPNANFIELRTASASGPVVMPLYGSRRPSRRTFTSGFFFFTNAVTSFVILAPVWFGTRRQETFTSARGGITVLTPGPVYPPTQPWISNVGIAQMRFMTSSASFVRIDLNMWSFLNPATVKPDLRKSSSSAFVGGTTSL
jgi:hypothetical protein